MTPVSNLDLPPERQRDIEKARKLEIWTIVYIATCIGFLSFAMGSSQAMRSSFFDAALSAIPAINFLVCLRIARRPANPEYPYGYHGVVSIGYLASSLTLLCVGIFLLIEAVMKIVNVERTTIGGMELFGHTIWAGWPMLLAVTYASIPSFFLGRAKLKLAPKIHDKILYADAKMMKADWMGGSATIVGVLGVGFGFWWVDPVAGGLISLSIVTDGWGNVKVAVSDLMERRPMKTDRSGPEPLPGMLRERMKQYDWVESAEVRLREVGHVFFGEIFITPKGAPADLPGKVRTAVDDAKALNWRIRDITITVLGGQDKDCNDPGEQDRGARKHGLAPATTAG